MSHKLHLSHVTMINVQKGRDLHRDIIMKVSLFAHLATPPKNESQETNYGYKIGTLAGNLSVHPLCRSF